MEEKNYWVGSLKSTGHPFATFLVGEYVDQDEKTITLAMPIRVIEVPNQQGGMVYQFLQDEFFTTPTPVKVEKEVVFISKILDPATDAKMYSQIMSHYTQLRMSKSGLVPAQPRPTQPIFAGTHK